jgi:hypothetical protein
MKTLYELMEGRTFTYTILSLYALRCLSYVITKHYGPAAYWFFAFGITVSAEILIKKFP